MTTDLFGQAPAGQPTTKGRGPNGGKHYVVRKGYAAAPGTGPAEGHCGNCKHLYKQRLSKLYLKCELMRPKWTGGARTDVLARSPACARWESDKTEAAAVHQDCNNEEAK